MVGWLVLKEEKGLRVRLERTSVCGLSLLRAEIPTGGLGRRALLRRVGRAAQLLSRAGCRRVLADADFLYWQALLRWELHPVDPSPLCQALAAPLALAFLHQRGILPQSASVALRGSRVSRPMFQAAELLCAQVRRLIISAPAGGAELSQYLRSEYGLPSLEEGAGAAPDVALVFAPGHGPSHAALLLCTPAPQLEGLSLRPTDQRLPEGTDKMALLALLWEEGRIGIDAIEIFSTGRGGNDLDR